MKILNNKTLALMLATTAVMSGQLVADDKNKFSYTYIEGAYVHDNFNANGLTLTDRDGVGDTTDDNFGTFFDATGNGGAGRFSLALPFNSKNIGFHIVADYVQTRHYPGVDIINVAGIRASGTVSTTQKEWRAAVGLHTKLSDKFSFFAEMGVVNTSVDFANSVLTIDSGGTVNADLAAGNGSKMSFDGKAGVRAFVGNRFELLAYARYNGNGRYKSSADGQSIDFSGKVVGGAGALFHFTDHLAVGLDYEFAKPGRARAVARLSF